MLAWAAKTSTGTRTGFGSRSTADRLRHAETGELLTVEPAGEIKGWGHLDGPSCRVTDDVGWSVDVPKVVIDQLEIAVDTEA